MTPVITYLIIVTTVFISIRAFPPGVVGISNFTDHTLYISMAFNPYAISKYGQKYRFLSAGFVHANWAHLFINMLVLYFFRFTELYYAEIFGPVYGRILFLFMYLSAIVISNLPDYFKYRNNPSYTAVGASGAVSAVLFSFILFNPNTKLTIFPFVFIGIPAFLFGIGYLIYEQIMSKREDNIGHNAHFWGAVYGFLFPVVLRFDLIVNFFNAIFHRF